MKLILLATLVAAATATTSSIPRACVAPHDKYPFCNPSLSMAARVDDLISRLKLEEKPYLLTARESPKGNISRLGIPEYDWGGNCIHGVQSNCAPDGRCPTSFPDPNALGAAFNRSAWRSLGRVIGVEMRALWLQNVGEHHYPSNLPHFGLDCWSPNIGIVRDPRWGRNLETPSEDPLVCGTYGAEYSLGLQNGADKRFAQGITTLKHFDANSLEGHWGPKGTITRHTFDANISQYDLASTYLPAFKQAVQEGGALGVMCSPSRFSAALCPFVRIAILRYVDAHSRVVPWQFFFLSQATTPSTASPTARRRGCSRTRCARSGASRATSRPTRARSATCSTRTTTPRTGRTRWPPRWPRAATCRARAGRHVTLLRICLCPPAQVRRHKCLEG